MITSTTERILARAAELEAEGIAALGVVADLTDEGQVAALAARASRLEARRSTSS